MLCLAVCIGSARAGELPQYVEFARTYGIVRYFSPNPYTQRWSESDWMKVCALLASRSESQPLEQVFRPLAPTLFFSDAPASAPKAAALGPVALVGVERGWLKSPVQPAAPVSDAPAWYYAYSGSGELRIPLFARLFIPGLADYIPYYKTLVREDRAPLRRLPPGSTMPIGSPASESFTSSMHCLARLSTRRRLAACSPMPGAAGTDTGAQSPASPRGAASSSGCSRTGLCGWPM